MYRLLEGRLASFIDGRILFNPEHLFRIGATRKTRKNEEKKTFPNHGIFPMDSPLSYQRKRSSSIDARPSYELKIKKRSRSCDTHLFPDIKQYTIIVSQLFYSH